MIIKEFMPEAFFERLKDLLDEKKIKPKTLSKAMGISENTAREWVSCERVPTTVNYFKLCKYLDVNPLYLYGLSDERGVYADKRLCKAVG